jgi:hypothetical protein
MAPDVTEPVKKGGLYRTAVPNEGAVLRALKPAVVEFAFVLNLVLETHSASSAT